MSSSSAHSNSGPSLHSGSSYSDNLLQLENNNSKEHKDTLSHPEDILSQPEDSTMTGRDRSKNRNVHIFNASDRNTTIGGLILTKENDVTNCVTNANFYAMIEIITITTSDFTLRNESNITIEKDNCPLQPGNYYIHAPRKFLGSFIRQ